MPDTTPRKIARLSDIGLAVTVVGAAATAAAFTGGLLGWHATVIVYLAFVSTAAVCGVNSALARCHVAIASAFAVGVKHGRATAPIPTPRPGLRKDSAVHLKVVD